jgi:site-specific DNA-methyltransferase (adenine-specific)
VTAPYYTDDRVTLHLGDCRTLLDSGAVDVTDVGVVVADPPYGETSLVWDRWQAGWVDAIAGRVRRSCSLWCFGSMRMFLDRHDEFVAAGWRLAQDIVWEKHNGSSSAADRFRRVHEYALQWYRGPWEQVWRQPVTTPDATARQVRRKARPPQWGEIGEHSYRSTDCGPRLARSVLKVRSEHGRAIHPTQKPLGIIEPLLRYSLAPGGTVLDPFAGSCSTLVAAREAGYRAIGIEADEAMCEKAAERLAAAPLDLWGAVP